MNNTKNKFKYIFNLLIKLIIFLFYLLKKLFRISPIIYKYLRPILSKSIGNAFRHFKRLFRFSLTFKITVVYIFSFFVLLSVLSASILGGFHFFLMKQSYEQVEKTSLIIENYVKNPIDIPIDIIDETAYREDIDVTIFDNNKNVVHSTEDSKHDIIFYDILNTEKYSNTNNLNFIVSNKKIVVNDENFYIQISKELTKENTYVEILFLVLVFPCTIGIIFTIIIGSKLSRKMLLPIKTMTSTAKEISVGDLNTRLNVNDSQDELKDLAITFNEMLDNLQDSYERKNQFVSDASHELRTPIAVIQGYANLLDRWGKNNEKVLDESITAIKKESENMKDLIEKLLFLARSDKNTQKVEKTLFALDELIDEVVKETKLIDTSHTLLNETKENISIHADRKLLKQALRIFIDNSVKFTPDNGMIKAYACLKGKSIVLIIEDTGMGIPSQDIPHIFERFYRSDKSRTKKTGGTGLGLSIAKWIIDQHNASVQVESTVDIGTKISICFPNERCVNNVK